MEIPVLIGDIPLASLECQPLIFLFKQRYMSLMSNLIKGQYCTVIYQTLPFYPTSEIEGLCSKTRVSLKSFVVFN